MIFTSGQIPLDASGVLVSGGIEEQTRMVLDNLTRVLEAAGAGLGDVVKTTVFLSDMADFASFNAVYAEYFAAPFPARSCVQAARLPRDVRVEIEAIAVL
jgi:2-iminobutanoate/2-iminopropanoate deaminase